MEEVKTFIKENLTMEAQRGLCVHMHNLGIPTSSIKETLGVSSSYVSKWINRYKLDGINTLNTQYKGKTSFLSSKQREKIVSFLSSKKECSLQVLQEELITRFDVSFKSKQSYYNLLKEGGLSWHKTEKSNPKKDMNQVLEKRTEIKKNWIRKKKQLKKVI